MEWITAGINKAREGGVDRIVDATPFDTDRVVNKWQKFHAGIA